MDTKQIEFSLDEIETTMDYYGIVYIADAIRKLTELRSCQCKTPCKECKCKKGQKQC